MASDNQLQVLKNFLQAYFHQDIESPEAALQALIKEESPHYLTEVVTAATSFLASSLTEDEKNQFISNHCDLYFPALNQSPVQWLENVVQQLQQALPTSSDG